jgi:hypothetical protein
MVSKKLGRAVAVAIGQEEQPGPCHGDELFSESIRVLKEGDMEGEQARTLREWARWELLGGNREHGEALWAEAREIFGKLGATVEYDRMAQFPS